MKVLLTGGSGDLGNMVGPSLENLGHTVTNFDLRQSATPYGEFVQGSILDRNLLSEIIPETECIIHIAALHGIHEFRQSASPHQFWDINVTGTYNLLEAARQAHIGRFIFISSTSVSDAGSEYGHSKILAEEVCKSFTVLDSDMSIIRLRPRAFIPHWNKDVYSSFVDWAKWFWGGAVHINDVSQAVVKSVELLLQKRVPACPVLAVDGKYDYTPEELSSWDQKGLGSTFKNHYGQHYYDLAVAKGLDPSLRPSILDISETKMLLGYLPSYSLKDLLEELEKME